MNFLHFVGVLVWFAVCSTVVFIAAFYALIIVWTRLGAFSWWLGATGAAVIWAVGMLGACWCNWTFELHLNRMQWQQCALFLLVAPFLYVWGCKKMRGAAIMDREAVLAYATFAAGALLAQYCKQD